MHLSCRLACRNQRYDDEMQVKGDTVDWFGFEERRALTNHDGTVPS